ncbi:MAG: hypothetical protein KAJ76_03835 [Candidatus Heimdallarchaeota archaeon]|nr:hypothetical protein [Candidatus Heimdallarchaeota archaeon]MCK5157597.1 hypothetical protein [Candidatus Heimdallarchaeota archaeon]MCK5298013.1 hypothetical protein [Candidatus Heimdallarchaeota archaeon]
MSEVTADTKTKRRTIIIFSIINLILITGIVMFIVAIIDGGGGPLDSELVFGLGLISMLIMIVAVAADLIYLIIVLVRRSRNKKNTSEVIYR